MNVFAKLTDGQTLKKESSEAVKKFSVRFHQHFEVSLNPMDIGFSKVMSTADISFWSKVMSTADINFCSKVMSTVDISFWQTLCQPLT